MPEMNLQKEEAEVKGDSNQVSQSLIHSPDLNYR
jgi:hypothetical protein